VGLAVVTVIALMSRQMTNEVGRTITKPGDVAAWDPDTNRWNTLQATAFHGDTNGATTIWTGSRLLVWGFVDLPKVGTMSAPAWSSRPADYSVHNGPALSTEPQHGLGVQPCRAPSRCLWSRLSGGCEGPVLSVCL
jgi:hypothetical protein